MEPVLLQVKDLKTTFHTDQGLVRAVDGVSFHVHSGETLGIVGESGCGKSVSCLSVIRLIQQPPGRIESGQVIFKGRDLLALPEREMRAIRGNEIAMIFQDPMISLNPVLSCGSQVDEAIRIHQQLPRKQAWEKTVEMFSWVGIPNPAQRAREYPHQMSGGMRQRVMIAMALSCNPSLLIADEPTTALDVTIQAQILDLLRRLQKETGMAVILITHDLGVVSETADRVLVMYAGRIVEESPAAALFEHPVHPYTRGLMDSLPRTGGKLHVIPGNVPDLHQVPQGCAFHPRCGMAVERCARETPRPEPVGGGRLVSCREREKCQKRS